MISDKVAELLSQLRRCDVRKARWILRRCILLEERMKTADPDEQDRITQALSSSYEALKLAASRNCDGYAVAGAFKAAAGLIDQCLPHQPREDLPDDLKRLQSLKAAVDHLTSNFPVKKAEKPLEVALTVVHSDPPRQDTVLYKLSENAGYDLRDIVFLIRLQQPQLPERVPRFFSRELKRHNFTTEGSQFQHLKRLTHSIDDLPPAPTGGVDLHAITTAPNFVLLVVGEKGQTPDRFAVTNVPQDRITNVVSQYRDQRRVFRHYQGGWTYDYKPNVESPETWKSLQAAGRLKFNRAQWISQIVV